MKKLYSLSLLVLVLSLASSVVRADDKKEGKKDGKNFESHKAEILSHIDSRIQKMHEHRGCVSAATDREALKKCRESMREHMEEMREKRHTERH